MSQDDIFSGTHDEMVDRDESQSPALTGEVLDDTEAQARHYQKTTDQTEAARVFARVWNETNNATEAYLAAYPNRQVTRESARVLGHRMLTNVNVKAALAEIDQVSRENALAGIVRIGQLINSDKEAIALDASKFSVEQERGKAKQKHEHAHLFVATVVDLTGQGTENMPDHIRQKLKEAQAS